ncbi:hypothetical protein [Aureispira anguillae]|uniref:Uncharacterized protein n=1 Tax=Aureispira anguillae TaxID=2864201 RepID=A0A915YH75_9BACT|nr:hypothetical protein [Aureispira anguillae]BDS13013.1 hypothetical protein AsAng_0037410 [Aureispira anguillae]
MIYFILILLPLSVGVAKLSRWSSNRQKILLRHQEEVARIKTKFYEAIRMKFIRVPIVVQTKKELSYYNKMKVHYKNSTRKIELLPYNLGENATAYESRKRAYIVNYCRSEKEEIEHGQKAYSSYFNQVQKEGLLAYLNSPFGTEKSKEFIYQTIEFLLTNPKAEYGNYSRSKELVF